MKSKSSYPFTLKDISELLDLKLSIWSDKIKLELGNKIKQSEIGIIAEMDRRFASVDDRFDEVDKRFTEMDKRFGEMDKRFNKVEDKLESIDSRLIIQSERVKKLEKQSFVSA